MEEIEKIATEIPEDICDIEIDFYGRKLAVGSSTGKIYIFENLNGNYSKVSEISAHIGPIFKLSWSHPSFGPILASCGFDKKVNLYKIDPQYKLEKIYEHDKHNNCITALKFSPSSNNLLLISGDLNGNIITCEYLDKDFSIKEILGHDFGVNSIDFFDDKTFVTCGNDNIVKIWNYLNENRNVEIKNIFVINDNNICTKDLSCKDNKHFVCCGYSGDEGIVNYYVLNDENKWEVNEIYKQNGKLEKIRFNEEHTCIAVIDESGKESIIMENELNI
jgi:protein transport protein SEC13